MGRLRGHPSALPVRPPGVGGPVPTGRHLLRREVRRLGRDEEAARVRRQVLHRHLASHLEALHSSFGFYCAADTSTAQNEKRTTRRLTLTVLAIGGAESFGNRVGNAMKLAADDVQTLVIPDCGHWVAEQAPDELLAALTAFLNPYRDGQTAVTAAATAVPSRCELMSRRVPVPRSSAEGEPPPGSSRLTASRDRPASRCAVTDDDRRRRARGRLTRDDHLRLGAVSGTGSRPGRRVTHRLTR
jgi:hypothetical protein